MKRSFFVLYILLGCFVGASSAETISCPPDNTSVVSSTKASANAFSNITSSKGSLKYELNAMLTARIDEATADKESISIVLSTTPNKFLEKYSDQATCQEMLTQTEKEPFSYRDKKFKTKDELVSWFYDFTQGSGEEGEDLYRRCPGSCSPQYTTIIKPISNVLQLDVFVICSHARDKSDNQYKLSSYLTSSC